SRDVRACLDSAPVPRGAERVLAGEGRSRATEVYWETGDAGWAPGRSARTRTGCRRSRGLGLRSRGLNQAVDIQLALGAHVHVPVNYGRDVEPEPYPRAIAAAVLLAAIEFAGDVGGVEGVEHGGPFVRLIPMSR